MVYVVYVVYVVYGVVVIAKQPLGTVDPKRKAMMSIIRRQARLIDKQITFVYDGGNQEWA